MSRMVARHSFRYAGRRLAIGEEFDSRSDRDALVLEAAGRAKRIDAAGEKREKVARRRGRPPKVEFVAEPVDGLSTEDQSVVDEYAPSRYYGRRDMEAE